MVLLPPTKSLTRLLLYRFHWKSGGEALIYLLFQENPLILFIHELNASSAKASIQNIYQNALTS